MGQVCAFFGHRFISNISQVQNTLNTLLLDLIKNKGISTFWLGGYGDFDNIAHKTLSLLKKEHPHIQLCLVLAYLPQQKENYQFQKKLYDFIFYPEGLELAPNRFAISQRNRYMAVHCDLVVSYLNNPFGGAYRAVKTALHAKKKIFYLGNLILA